MQQYSTLLLTKAYINIIFMAISSSLQIPGWKYSHTPFPNHMYYVVLIALHGLVNVCLKCKQFSAMENIVHFHSNNQSGGSVMRLNPWHGCPLRDKPLMIRGGEARAKSRFFLPPIKRGKKLTNRLPRKKILVTL